MKKILITLLTLALASCSGKLSPTGLMCEYQTDPQAMDEPSPRLSWINIQSGKGHGNDQSAWQIQVATSVEALSTPDVWDSGKTSGASAPYQSYAGPALQSATRYWWRVRVWDSADRVSEWSTPAQWVTGYLDPSEWTAEWIGAPWDGENPRDWRDGHPIYEEIKGDPSVAQVQEFAPSTPAPLLRKSFRVDKDVTDAHLFISGLGYCEPYLNGEKIGDDLLSPDQTDYTFRRDMDRRRLPMVIQNRAYSVFYLGYDVTAMIRNGDNVLGCILGNGFFNSVHIWTAGYGSPRVIAQLEITYADGSKDSIRTDRSWKARESAVRANDIFGGEVYDARYETAGWSSPETDDSEWDSAAARTAPDGALRAQMGPHDKVIETFEPLKVEKFGDRSYRVVFPEEIAGRIRLTGINGAKGDTLRIRYLCTTGASYDYNGISRYVCAGRNGESYAPLFDWYVFHSAIIENWEGDMTAENVLAEAVSSNVPQNSSFTTSDTLINAISDIWVRTQKNNMHGGVPSDCPHRERGPYTGDGQIASAMVMHNFDARAFYNKWLKDISNAQDAQTGYVPNGAPWEAGCGGGVAWGAAMTIIPWEYYLAYGDRRLLEEHYEAARMQTDYMGTWETPEGTMLAHAFNDSFIMNLGEHVPPFTAPSQEMVHTFMWWYCADITSKMALVLGKADDADRYNKLADRIVTAFHDKFYDAEKGSYGPDECDVFALKMGVPERDRVIGDLRKWMSVHGNHLVTGLIGTRILFEVLSDCGLNDLAWEILHKDDYPSYGEMIKNGSTTMWEQWDGKHSHDHPMFGGGLVWFYRTLAGISPDPAHPAYRHSFIKPYFPEGLDSVDYTFDTVYGPIRVAWQRSGSNAVTLDITIPEGCSASLLLPDKDPEMLKSGSYRITSKI